MKYVDYISSTKKSLIISYKVQELDLMVCITSVGLSSECGHHPGPV